MSGRESEIDYYLRRAVAEIELATACTDADVAVLHRQLAAHHEERAAILSKSAGDRFAIQSAARR